MSTEKQQRANRANGALGGVKSPEGKIISSKNAIKHGVLSHCITKFDRLDADQIYSEFAEEFGDSSPSRKVLLQQLTLITLRLARCARAETEMLREALNPRVVEIRDVMANLFEETVVVSEGEPATITSEALEKLGLIYERYEPQLVSQFLRIVSRLTHENA